MYWVDFVLSEITLKEPLVFLSWTLSGSRVSGHRSTAQHSSFYLHCVLPWEPNRHLFCVSFCLLGCVCLVWAGAQAGIHTECQGWAEPGGDWAVILIQAQEAVSTLPRFFFLRVFGFPATSTGLSLKTQSLVCHATWVDIGQTTVFLFWWEHWFGDSLDAVTKNPRSSSNCSHNTWQKHDQIIMPLRNVYIVEYVGSTTDEWNKKLGKIKGRSSFSNNIRPQMRTIWGRKTSARDTWEVHTEEKPEGLSWQETALQRWRWRAGCTGKQAALTAEGTAEGTGSYLKLLHISGFCLKILNSDQRRNPDCC